MPDSLTITGDGIKEHSTFNGSVESPTLERYTVQTDGPHFEPLYEAHAIGEMVVFFEFAPSLVPAYALLSQLRGLLQNEFPRFTLEPAHQLKLEGANAALGPAPPSLIFQRFRPDGGLEWMMRADENSISIHCLNYTRWKDVWGKVEFIASLCLSKINSIPTTSLSTIGLKYVDQFYFKGAEETYDASLLFDRNSPLLHSRAFASGLRWHCHTGWFEKLAERECLSQLNVSSGQGTRSDGASVVAVTIDHTLRVPMGLALSELAYSPAKLALPVSTVVEGLHLENKRVLIKLLTDSMAQRISLRSEEI